ncbi:MAG: GspE/PulE family protein [Candidatus Gottesmanbacteria bacterium]
MPINQVTLIKLIADSGLISKDDLRNAQNTADHLGSTRTDILIRQDYLKEEDLGNLLSKFFKVKYIDLTKIDIPIKTLNLIPESLAVDSRVIVFAKKDDQVMVAMDDPWDLEAIELVRKTIGSRTNIIPHVTTPEGIKEALKFYKKRTKEEMEGQIEITKTKDLSAITIVNQLLEDACRQEASDIHIEPLSSQLLVRLRTDGVLHDHMLLAKEMHPAIVARIKILSELKLDEQRLPQDGRFSFETKMGEIIALRVSTAPTVYGEKIVLRILHDAISKFNLDELGLISSDQEIISRVIQRTHGMFLVTGPTGSGKTTTLYTILGLLNRPGVNIMTIEDPVENRIPRVNQIQVNPQINLDFASGLRSMLRQDPDIIMVGEIRDRETAVIAINAAMTGHLVFSSVHANTAAGAIPRMIDLGVEPFLLASTVNMVIAQRLVRILCPKCLEEIKISPLINQRLEKSQAFISPDIKKNLTRDFRAKGCSNCYFTGFRGRMGIFEIINLDIHLQELIINKSSSNLIWQAAREDGARSMLEDGLLKANRGVTPIEEVFRVISE